MIVFRYLYKEVSQALQALIGIILLIFLSNQFMLYLSRLAGGRFPGGVLLKLLFIGIPMLMSLLLPLGFYIAMILAYSRLYADNEMTSLMVCGYSERKLIRHSLLMALGVTLVVGALTLYALPILHTARVTLMKDKGIASMVKTLAPKRFRQFSNGRYVMYLDDIDSERDDAKHIFLAEKDKRNGGWQILRADSGQIAYNKETGQTNINLGHGSIFQGRPGTANLKHYSFDRLHGVLLKPARDFSTDMSTLSTAKLWPLNNSNKNKMAELNWRLSVPLMAFILALLAIPLSKVRPRQGKFAGLIPAILLYTVYANFLFVGRDWLKQGVLPWWAGLWWLHLLFLVTALLLNAYSRKRQL